MMAPFMVPDDFDGGNPDANPVAVDSGDGNGMQMASMGSPHLTLAGTIVALLGLKFFTESNLVSFDVSEVKVSVHNIVNIGLQASVFIIGAKLGSAYLLRRGFMVPGLADFVGAL